MEDGTSKSPGHIQGTMVDPAAGDPAACEARSILDRIADKWSLLVITALTGRTLRFSELRREIDGVSQRMLTLTLRQLERDGVVRRTVYPVVPPRVEYELTELGFTLRAAVCSIVTWTQEHYTEIMDARSEYDDRHREANAS